MLVKANKNIILFDGECILCNGFVQWLLKKDKKDIFRFVALQSNKGKTFISNFKLPDDLSTVLLIRGDGKIFSYSDVIIEAGMLLGGFYSVLIFLKIIPRSIRNLVYNWIAKNRYKWFGKRDTCMIPGPDIREKFIL
jgi:predicted DCC family thiol-disulfide oxidoreductase YuxK